MPVALAILIAYAAGSIPAAYIAGRIYGIDLREHGSGNLGATNVMRVLGSKVGIAVFAFDMAKGGLPVLFLPGLVSTSWTGVGSADGRLVIALLCGFAAIIGHVRPVFLWFGRGGKGVATAAGVFIALAPIQTILTIAVFAVVVLVSGYVSLGSLVGALLLPILLVISVGWNSPLMWVSVLVAAFVCWTHRANISRLRAGEEHRFGKPDAPRPSSVAAAAIAGVVILAVLVAARFA